MTTFYCGSRKHREDGKDSIKKIIRDARQILKKKIEDKRSNAYQAIDRVVPPLALPFILIPCLFVIGYIMTSLDKHPGGVTMLIFALIFGFASWAATAKQNK